MLRSSLLLVLFLIVTRNPTLLYPAIALGFDRGRVRRIVRSSPPKKDDESGTRCTICCPRLEISLDRGFMSLSRQSGLKPCVTSSPCLRRWGGQRGWVTKTGRSLDIERLLCRDWRRRGHLSRGRCKIGLLRNPMPKPPQTSTAEVTCPESSNNPRTRLNVSAISGRARRITNDCVAEDQG